jgi:hypothetical protein
VAVAGKAKSGKTFFLSLLMAAGLTQRVMKLERKAAPLTSDIRPLRVLWYDTEQSEQSTQDILKNRIMPMARGCEDTDALSAFNVRCESCATRLKLFEAGVEYVKPDMVILDGVRDLISDINDGVEAQRITEQLMTLAQQHNCCIVCVLHQNKGDGDRNMRGWIGTELTNKVFEVYSCEKMSNGTFKVEQTHSRKYDIGRSLFYTVNKTTGLPEECDKPFELPRDAQGRWMSPRLNSQYIISRPENPSCPWEWNLVKLFTDAMGGKDYLPYCTLMSTAMKLANITDRNAYYSIFRKAVDQQVVGEVTHPSTGQQMVQLRSQRLNL